MNKTTAPTANPIPGFSLFAQLLATERLHIRVDANAKTASFAPKSRTLVLPSWSGLTEDAWLLFIAHEVGHALYTPHDSFALPSVNALVAQYGDRAVLNVLNVFEDVRIERLVRNKYRGLTGVFTRGYHDLLSQNFFGFAPDSLTPETWRDRTPLDRVNVYAKVGGLLRQPLTDAQEIAWYNRALTVETFEEVVALVAEVMDALFRAQQSQQQNNNQSEPNSSQSPSPKPDGAAQSTDAQGTQDGETAKNAQPSTETPATTAPQDAQEETPAPQNAQGANGAPQPAQPATDANGEAQDASAAQGPASQPSGASSSPFEIASQDQMSKALSQTIQVEWNEHHTFVLPANTDHLHYNDVSVEQWLAKWEATPDQRAVLAGYARAQRRDQSAILASMIATFRANQAAQQAHRVQISRSGVIDVNKLPQYKLTEDLFLRRVVKPDAQNHGFVVHVDWSGSMETKMSVVLWQVLHLIWFAESIHVPLTVQAFSNALPEGDAGKEYRDRFTKARVSPPPPFGLIELYRSTAPAAVKQDAQALLFACVLRYGGIFSAIRASQYSNGVLNARDAEDMSFTPALPKALGPTIADALPTFLSWDAPDAIQKVFVHPLSRLGGTPLLLALVSSVDAVRKFRAQHRVEQCVSVWLTDGDDTDGLTHATYLSAEQSEEYVEKINACAAENRYFQSPVIPNASYANKWVDPRSGRTYTVEHKRALSSAFAVHRALTGATVLCVDITSMPVESLKRVLPKDDLQVLANQIVPPVDEDTYGSRRGRYRRGRRITPKKVVQTRRRVIITTQQAPYYESGLLAVSGKQYPTIGCDAYVVTHPSWWSAAARSPIATHAVKRTLTSLAEPNADGSNLGPSAEQIAAQAALARALSENNAHLAMRRFADLLVPFMASGRDIA